MEQLARTTVIQDDIETPGHGNNQLVQVPVRVSSSRGTTRNIVKVIDTVEFKRNTSPALHRRKIATFVVDNGKIQNMAVIQAHDPTG
jgi:hypothetical protein